MKDRFDLEQEILQIKGYADNIRMVAEKMIDGDYDENYDRIFPSNIDTYVNALEGLATLLDMHSDKMFDTMSQCFQLDSYKKSVLEDKI